jgi:Tol biopolymer transport system component
VYHQAAGSWNEKEEKNMAHNLNRLAFLALVLAFCLSGEVCHASPPAPEETLPGEAVGCGTGVMPTPRKAAAPSAEIVNEMFERSREIGAYAVFEYKWKDLKGTETVTDAINLCNQYGITPIIVLAPTEPDGIKANIVPPADLKRKARSKVSFKNADIESGYIAAVKSLAELKPPYLVLAVEANRLAFSDINEYVAFATSYKKAYTLAKEVSPETEVSLSFQWDLFYIMEQKEPKKHAQHKKLVDLFRPQMDFIAFRSMPTIKYKEGASTIPKDYFEHIGTFLEPDDRLMLQVGWPSSGESTEEEQAKFVGRLPELLQKLNPCIVCWDILHDVEVSGQVVTLGLLRENGEAKPAFKIFKDFALTFAEAAPAPEAAKSQKPNLFNIFTAELDGDNVVLLISDDKREMTHARVSPDKTRVTFTRYNHVGGDGTAKEDYGYAETEIMLVNMDGSGLETIVPPKKDTLAANSCWAPDGKSLIFISTDNPEHVPRLKQIDLETREISDVPAPADRRTSDPHWEGDKVVFPVRDDDDIARVWVMDADGENARQVTDPERPEDWKDSIIHFGDFDPKISPDGSTIAFMRYFGGEKWRVFVVDTGTGKEKDLSPDEGLDGLPEWSSDGKKILFRHINREKPKTIGLYTMNPDGKDRKMVPLPRGYLYKHASFFPGEGSSDEAHIIYCAISFPELP